MAGIILSATKKNEKYIDKKTVYSGILIVVISVAWRFFTNF